MTNAQQLYVKEMDKLINRFILRAKKFVECSAFPYGTADLLRRPEATNKLTYDHEYFNFTKSTKTLVSARALLKLNHNEDVLILVRSLFENYISSRYLNENDEEFEDLTITSLKLFFAEYNYSNGKIIDREGNVISERKDPSKFKLGKDAKYYTDFYSILSSVGHSNFGIVGWYMNENMLFTIEKNNYPVITRFFVLFVFTKLFEHVVTVEGEDFESSSEEKLCYKLVIDSLLYQDNLIPQIIEALKCDLTANPNTAPFFTKRLIKMLKGMQKSLREELGSVNKPFLT